ncbi:uncharacterized protein DUF4181 [Planomicrobium soli]|uniref:Uncharacterized protein DUF4181 n=1 Tax=Planomicrobium soli TaxID=1176648 RepID=A0A2P8H5L1_9BACL|nr:DUF4181 domain-containing protein [Planomicrobium soli]PSL41479.1 uncharacterized protein DUF4181 [Planomicrobium soli]
MNTATVAGLVIAFLVYLIISHFYFKKRLNIKAKSTFMFHQDRSRISVAIDGILLVGFIYAMFWINVEKEAEMFSGVIKISPLFALFFLTSLNRGIEERVLHREEKAYYHDWLESLLCLAVFFILLIGEL